MNYEQTYTLTVNPINDAPVLEAISDQAIDEDGLFIYSMIANDIDGEESGIIIPLFRNCHTHLGDTLARKERRFGCTGSILCK